MVDFLPRRLALTASLVVDSLPWMVDRRFRLLRWAFRRRQGLAARPAGCGDPLWKNGNGKEDLDE